MELTNLLSKDAQTAIVKWKKWLKRLSDPLGRAIEPTVQNMKEMMTPVVEDIKTGMTEISKPIVEPIKKSIQKADKIWKINTFLSEKGITVDTIRQLAEADGTDPNEAFEFFKKNGIKIEWMDEIVAKEQEAKAQEIPQWEDLWFLGGTKEFSKGVFRAGEQIPSIIWSGLWFAGKAIWTWLDYITPWLGQGAKDLWQNLQDIWNEITYAGMTGGGSTPLTQKQIDMRKIWGQMALTAPIGWSYIARSKWLGSLAMRSGVVWAWFWWATPIMNKGNEATLSDIWQGAVLGWVWWAIAWPVISKVIAPAIGGIVSKTGKYWKALMKGWIQWAGRSISSDIQAMKEWIKTPIVQTTTRDIPRTVIRRDLGFTPTQRKNIERITGKDEATYLLEKWLAWKWKEELAEIFMRQSDDMYHEITKQLEWVESRVQSPVAKEALMDILDQLQDGWKIERAYAKDIEWIKAMLARDDFSLSDLNNIRRAYDKVNQWMFTVSGKARSGIENDIDVKVRQDLSDQLQKEALKYGIDVRWMNTELRVWIEMKDALLSRLSQEEKNNFIGLQDLWVSAILSGWNPVTALATIWAKKYAEKVAPSLAQKAFNLNKAPNVPRTVSRGNTITARNKSSRLGLANNTRDNVVRNGVEKKQPIIPTEESNIPGSRKTTVEVPSNPNLTKKKTWIQKKKGIVTPEKSENTPIKEKKGITAKTGENEEKTGLKPKQMETNITRNEKIEKWFSDSAKARWDKWEFTSTERWNAIKYLKSNYKGKEYTIDWKKYKVDAIDNRNEQVRLIDNEWNVIRVKTNKLPETKVTDKDIFDYYNQREQKGYKTVTKPLIKK